MPIFLWFAVDDHSDRKIQSLSRNIAHDRHLWCVVDLVLVLHDFAQMIWFTTTFLMEMDICAFCMCLILNPWLFCTFLLAFTYCSCEHCILYTFCSMLMSMVVSLRICSWTLLQIVAIVFHHAGMSAQQRSWKNLVFSELCFMLTHVVKGSIKNLPILLLHTANKRDLCICPVLGMRESSTAAHKCSTAWGRPLLSGNWAKPQHDSCSFCLDSSSWTYCALGAPRLYCANVLWKPCAWYWFVHNNTAAAVWEYSKTLLVHTHFKCTNG